MFPSGETDMVLVRLQSLPAKQINIKEGATNSDMLHKNGQ